MVALDVHLNPFGQIIWDDVAAWCLRFNQQILTFIKIMIIEGHNAILVGDRCGPCVTVINRAVFTITIHRKLGANHGHFARETIIGCGVRLLRHNDLASLLLVSCGQLQLCLISLDGEIDTTSGQTIFPIVASGRRLSR